MNANAHLNGQLNGEMNGSTNRHLNGYTDGYDSSSHRPSNDGALFSESQSKRSGLLWRTAFRTPCIRWILPGCIGRPGRTSVAFVSETYVELKEWDRTYETLHTVATIADFPARISSAQLLGERKTSRDTHNDDHSMAMDGEGLEPHMPHQILVLVLENATMVFLAATEVNG